ncbi:MAG: hypothetical protein JWN74_3465 [Acidobacteriaceae bacterium]|nr:hypothetical protein [Acidobacteriaceae bacterium]
MMWSDGRPRPSNGEYGRDARTSKPKGSLCSSGLLLLPRPLACVGHYKYVVTQRDIVLMLSYQSSGCH